MNRYFTKINLCLVVIIISSLTPLKVFAVDTGFYSSNDILFYNPDACTSDGGDSSDSGSVKQTKGMTDFVDAYGEIAFNSGKKFGIPYEAILAQRATESGWKDSGLARSANNFFGIKAGSAWKGEYVTMQTSEVYHGVRKTIMARFRKYSTAQEGWDGYGQFITDNPIYKHALKYPGDYVNYIKEVAKAGYATAPDYASGVIGIANSIAAYIKKQGKLQPSSEVAKTNVPTYKSSGGSDSGSGLSASGGCSSDSGDASDTSQPDKAVKVGDGWSLKDGVDYSGTPCATGSTDEGVYSHPVTKYVIQRCGIKAVGIVNSLISQRTLNMIAAAAKDGITISGSGWRSYEQQQRTWNRCAPNCNGMVARPGDSNHERGLAIDMRSKKTGTELTKSDAEFKWLTDNGAKFGFINYKKEAWHWSMSGG